VLHAVMYAVTGLPGYMPSAPCAATKAGRPTAAVWMYPCKQHQAACMANPSTCHCLHACSSQCSPGRTRARGRTPRHSPWCSRQTASSCRWCRRCRWWRACASSPPPASCLRSQSSSLAWTAASRCACQSPVARPVPAPVPVCLCACVPDPCALQLLAACLCALCLHASSPLPAYPMLSAGDAQC
jgi:hypothetical protein